MVAGSEVGGLASRLTEDEQTYLEDLQKLRNERDLLKSIIDEQLVFKINTLESEVDTLKSERDSLVYKNNDLTYKLNCAESQAERLKDEALKNQRDYFNKKHADLIKQNERLQKENNKLQRDLVDLQAERDDLKIKLAEQIGIQNGFKLVLDQLNRLNEVLNKKLDMLFDLIKSSQDQRVVTLVSDIQAERDRHLYNNKIIDECNKIFELTNAGLSNVEIARDLYPGLARGPKKVSERKNSDYYRSLS